MGLPQAKHRYTVEEYLRQERDAAERHEYHDGEMVAMAGGTYEHSIILSNLIREVGNRLKGKPCRVAESNLRVFTPRSGKYVYPDASIVCGPPLFDVKDTHRGTIVNPRSVFEVLSLTTESYDRGEKFNQYREIESLQEYVLISQHTPRVESFLRQPDGGWLFTVAAGVDASMRFRSIEIELPLAEIYLGIEFAAADAMKPPDDGRPRE